MLAHLLIRLRAYVSNTGTGYCTLGHTVGHQNQNINTIPLSPLLPPCKSISATWAATVPHTRIRTLAFKLLCQCVLTMGAYYLPLTSFLLASRSFCSILPTRPVWHSWPMLVNSLPKKLQAPLRTFTCLIPGCVDPLLPPTHV